MLVSTSAFFFNVSGLCLVWEIRPCHCQCALCTVMLSIQCQNKSAVFVTLSNLMILLLIFFRGHFLNDVIYTASYSIRGIKCCLILTSAFPPALRLQWSPPFFLSASKCSNSIFQLLPWIRCLRLQFCLKSKQSLRSEKANQLCWVIQQFHKGYICVLACLTIVN